MAESIRIVLKTGVVFAGALIAGSLVRQYTLSQDSVESGWVATSAESFDGQCPRFVCDDEKPSDD